jgi:Ethylbenzene dehydrogenase
MKKTKELILFGLLALFFSAVLINFSGCKNDDQEIDFWVPPTPDPPPPSNELVSVKTSDAPVIDGSIDAAWDKATKLFTATEVPDPGNKVFEGYEGNRNEVTLRSMYDNEYIYFLAEWSDSEESLNRQTWYFDPADKTWKQEDRVPTFNNEGVMIRPAFYEDKFAFLFNIDNSVADWDTKTCWASCHTDVGEQGGYARHYTQPGETIDMWHWKMVRNNINNQADDQYQNDTQPNGRHGDDKDGGGYTNNKQDLQVTSTTDTVTVPKYFIPTDTYYYWITQGQIDDGIAKLITSVDENGVLGYDGGSIDPTNPEFQREGATTGARCIPSIYTTAFEGSRGDIEAKGVFMGTGWILEFKRALDTGETAKQDVSFSSLEAMAFGIAVFDNAGIAHGIKPGLKLSFKE